MKPIKKILPLAMALLTSLILVGCGTFGYEVNRKDVIYRIWDGNGPVEYSLENADPKTFEIIKQFRYAKDKDRVYYHRSVIEGAIPSTFTVLDDWLALDSTNVYYDGKVLPDRDAKTFERLNGNWTRDKNEIYFRNHAIDACDPGSFEAVVAAWAIDAECIYVGRSKILNVDRETFQALDRHYAKDKHHVYTWSIKEIGLIEPTEMSSPTAVNISKSPASHKNVISIIPNADSESFTIIDVIACRFDARDHHRCYEFGEATSCVCYQ